MPKENFQMKQELNCLTTGPCYELGGDKEEGMWKGIRKTDKTQEIITEMEMGESEIAEAEKNKTKMIYHKKKTINLKKIRTKNKIKTMRMKIDNIKMANA